MSEEILVQATEARSEELPTVEQTTVVDEVEEIIKPQIPLQTLVNYMHSTIVKYNGWNCISISKPGSVKDYFDRLKANMPVNSAEDLKDYVVVQVHKQVPALQESGLYVATEEDKFIELIRIGNPKFAGLVCSYDRYNKKSSVCIGDPFGEPVGIDSVEETPKNG